MTREKEHRLPTQTEAYVCIALVILTIFISLQCGLSIQFAIILAAIVSFLMAMRLGYTWSEMEKAICERMGKISSTILIMWVIGFLLGTMIFSGLIPMVVYYGFKLINPSFLYLGAFLACCIMSTMTGSSWTAAGTAGVACMALAQGHDASTGIMAGAVIAGSLFGDKLSPMSETTNLAPACAGTDLWSHIRAQCWTTIPAFFISAILFFVLGLGMDAGDGLPETAVIIMEQLDELFNWNIVLFVPLILMLFLALTKRPIIPTMLICGILSVILGVIVQGFSLSTGAAAAITGFSADYIIPEGYELNSIVENLLDRGGMTSMVTVVIICYCSFSLITILTKAGFLHKAVEPLINNMNTRVKAMLSAEAALFIIALISGNSYTGSVFVGEAWQETFEENGMGRQCLSRTLEDVGTCMLSIIPWSSSANFYATTLGVTAFGAGGYALYTVFPFACPIIALLLAIFGIAMYPPNKEEKPDLDN